MYLDLHIGTYHFSFLSSDYQIINVPDIVCLHLIKNSNHSYEFKAFFYQSKAILSCGPYRTKSKLYDVVQFYLQEFL